MRRKNHNILSHRDFIRRVVKYTLVSLSLIVVSLGIGMAGYHHYCSMTWTDSLYNASMILTGMGPAVQLPSDEAKVFVSAYAIFSGVIFLSTVGVFFAPFAHRLMHLLHVEPEDVDTEA